MDRKTFLQLLIGIPAAISTCPKQNKKHEPAEEMTSPQDLNLFAFLDDPEEIVQKVIDYNKP